MVDGWINYCAGLLPKSPVLRLVFPAKREGAGVVYFLDYFSSLLTVGAGFDYFLLLFMKLGIDNLG